MLKINMEYRKGILFIRISGDLTKYTYKSFNDYILPLINNQGIKYIVFNLDKMRIMDNYGKESLLNSINATRKNHGKGLICNSKWNFTTDFNVVENELSALKLLRI